MDLPVAFTQQMNGLLGKEEAGQLFKALSVPSPVSIRINSGKQNKYNTIFRYSKQERILWCKNGFYLEERPSFTFDPLFHTGTYYVQEASSMFLEQLFLTHVTSPVRVLDLCAAPGGKSTHIRDLLPQGSLLVANEVIRSRSHILAENLIKWGNPDTVITSNDPEDFSRLDSFFDVIVADVPCSGEGMFRKDPASIQQWSLENINICYQRQRRIIAGCWDALRPGGLLVYSTCTYNTDENEGNIQWICKELGAEVVSVEVPAGYSVTGNLSGNSFPVYRFFPHKVRGEGFFIAALRKTGNKRPEISVSPKRKKERKISGNLHVPTPITSWILEPDRYTFTTEENLLRATPHIHSNSIRELGKQLHLLNSGIILGEIKGKNIIPHQALAMSTALNPETFFAHELAYEPAIRYLRNEALVLDPSVPAGIVLLTHRKQPLGFVKNIGNRANNLYPPEWRIRSSYLPGQATLFYK